MSGTADTRSSSAGSAGRTASEARSRSSCAPTSRSGGSRTAPCSHRTPRGAAPPADRPASLTVSAPAGTRTGCWSPSPRSRTAPRPRRCAGCPGHVDSTRTRRPRTPRSSTTTSWSGSRVRHDRRRAGRRGRRGAARRRARTCSWCARPTAREVLVPFVTALVPVVDVRGGRRRGRRPARAARAAASRRRRTEPCASTSSRSSPTTSRRSSSRCPARRGTRGLLDVHVHDLRDWTHDRHRTVDDTPYGGGAGMVMSRSRGARRSTRSSPRDRRPATVLVVPTPAGEPFTSGWPPSSRRASTWCSRAAATRASTSGCSTTPRTRMRVREVSLGDYVLNGGEVAALVRRRGRGPAAARVHGQRGVAGRGVARRRRAAGVPGLHQAARPGAATTCPRCCSPGTTPGSRRGGTTRRVRRTAAAPPRPAAPQPHADRRRTPRSTCAPRRPADAGELLTLQRACWVQEAQANETLDIPPLREDLDDVRAWLDEWTMFVVRVRGRLVGAVRGRLDGDDLGHRPADGGARPAGPRPRALAAARTSRRRPARTADRLALFTGAGSARNQRMYRKAGYRRDRVQPEDPGVVAARPSRPRAG